MAKEVKMSRAMLYCNIDELKDLGYTGIEKEIDQLVYKLYELTSDRIKIVEEFGK